MKKTPLISLIIPAYNESANLEWHHGIIAKFFSKLPVKYEVIYINDGSTDNTLEILRKLSKKPSTRYISFSRNFGKEAATTAGLLACKGDAAIMIDADGQHPIELVETFVDEWHKGYKTVIGVRTTNKRAGAVKNGGSKLFYAILRILGADDSVQHGLTDFRLVDRQIIDEYARLTEHNRVTRNLLDWLGFKRKLIPFEANERHAGDASYSLRKLTKLAIDGIVKHSTRPLKFIGIIGFIVAFIAGLVGLFMVIEMHVLNDPLQLAITGTALLAVFLSFMVGIVLFCQGLLALYLETVFYETQNRPLFIIEEEG